MHTYWLVELRPATPALPAPTPAVYYTGLVQLGGDPLTTTDVHASPKWTRKQDAQKVASDLLGTLSCCWEAVEHGFMDNFEVPFEHV